MRTFLIGDLHGNVDLLHGLLREVGLHGERARREAGVLVVQIGDLVNVVARDVGKDQETLRVAKDLLDHALIGNHELPLLGGTPFNGYWPDPEVKHRYLKLVDEGFVIPAYLDGETLVTHAGVPEGLEWESAADAYDVISHEWLNGRDSAPIFNAVGRARGGWYPEGGILWSDWHDEGKNRHFSQVVGHTPLEKGPQGFFFQKRGDGTHRQAHQASRLSSIRQWPGQDDYDSFALNIDCGGKLGRTVAGVFLQNGQVVGFTSFTA